MFIRRHAQTLVASTWLKNVCTTLLLLRVCEIGYEFVKMFTPFSLLRVCIDYVIPLLKFCETNSCICCEFVNKIHVFVASLQNIPYCHFVLALN